MDHEAVAQQTQEWGDESIETSASDIVEALIGEFPVMGDLATSFIEEQIRENVTWSYSTPTKANNLGDTAEGHEGMLVGSEE